MKYLKAFDNYSKLNETESTPSHILDLFTDDRLKSYDIDKDFKISILRTDGSFKTIITDKKTNKVVGRVYIQDIRPDTNSKYKAEIRRLHVNDEYRGKKFGEILLTTIMNSFPEINLYAYPSPNRNKDMNDTNKEEYRNRLIKFYDRIGLKKASEESKKVERRAIKK